MKARSIFLVYFFLLSFASSGQSIIDSCLMSVAPSTDFISSSTLANMGALQADVIQWTGSAWIGGWAAANLTIPPPLGIVGSRAIFLGNGQTWTSGGEGFGVKLNANLNAGQTYTFTIAYVSHGNGSNGSFSPKFYTNSTGSMTGAVMVGNIPAAGNSWTTNNYTFTANASQAGHNWIILHTTPNGTTGLVKSFCNNIAPPPPCSVNLGNDTTLCQGSSLVLNASTANATYQWQNNSTNPVFTVTNAGTYWVKVTVNGCVARDTIVVSYLQYPSFNLGNDTTLCQGKTLTLQAGAASNYYWSNGTTGSTINVINAGTYWVKASNGLCVKRDTITVSFFPNSLVSLGNDTAMCPNDSITLSPGNGFSQYLWFNNSTASSVKVNSAGSYWVKATNINGCVASDTVLVSLYLQPSIITSNDTVCRGDTAILTASGGSMYLWINGATTPSIHVAPLNTTNYQVIAKSDKGCADTAFATAYIVPLFNMGITASHAICEGDNTVLIASGGTNYLWNTGDNTVSVTVSPAVSTTYTVDITDANACKRDTLVVVNVVQKPMAVAYADMDSVCSGTGITLIAGGGSSYLWSNGSTSNSISIIAFANSVYSCIITNSLNTTSCSDTAEVVISTKNCNTFYVPNAFVPAGINKIFKPVGNISPETDYYFTIYNRWGELVFETRNADIGWDGTHNGKLVIPGVYVYYIKVKLDGQKNYFEKTGIVTLVE